MPSVCSSGDILTQSRGRMPTPKCSSERVRRETPFGLDRHGRHKIYAGSAGSGAILNGRHAPITKRDFSPEKAEHRGSGYISYGGSPHLVATPTRAQVIRRFGERGTAGRPQKASRKAARNAALSNGVPTCSSRPLAPAPWPAPQATDRQQSGPRAPGTRAATGRSNQAPSREKL